MRKLISGVAIAGCCLVLAACGDEKKDVGVRANMGATVGIALPNTTSGRWLADGTNMVEQFTAMGYQVDLQYGEDIAENQIAQIQNMIQKGEKLLVIAPVDGSSLNEVLASAAKAGIPVISYDRLIRKSADVSYYASFDNFRVGMLQGRLLVDRLGLSQAARGPFSVELFAGSADDNNAKFYFNGAMTVLRPYLRSGHLVVKSGQSDFDEVTTYRGDPALAHQRMKDILRTVYRKEKVDAVLSPYDGISLGIIKALKLHGYTRGSMPVISGQDAELESVRSIIAGEQAGTVYKDTRELAKLAAQMGNALLTDSEPMVNDTTSYNNGVRIVPSYLLSATTVDQANYEALLVDGGYYTAEQLK